MFCVRYRYYRTVQYYKSSLGALKDPLTEVGRWCYQMKKSIPKMKKSISIPSVKVEWLASMFRFESPNFTPHIRDRIYWGFPQPLVSNALYWATIASFHTIWNSIFTILQNNAIYSQKFKRYYFFLLNPILFAICTSTFGKLCVTYTVTCRGELSSAPCN
jgi:hypothetical protein